MMMMMMMMKKIVLMIFIMIMIMIMIMMIIMMERPKQEVVPVAPLPVRDLLKPGRSSSAASP